MDDDFRIIMDRESRLARRGDPELARLIDDEFVEFGRSGMTWTRADVTAELGEPPRDNIRLEEMALRRLGDGIILCTYRSVSPRGQTLRSSIWIKRGIDWRIAFHQGTPVLEQGREN